MEEEEIGVIRGDIKEGVVGGEGGEKVQEGGRG